MVEIDSNHRLHSPAQSLFTGLQKIVTVEEASVECRTLLGHFTNEFVIVQLDPTALDHLVTKFTHKADVGRLTSEADVVDLAKDFVHAIIILLSLRSCRVFCDTFSSVHLIVLFHRLFRPHICKKRASIAVSACMYHMLLSRVMNNKSIRNRLDHLRTIIVTRFEKAAFHWLRVRVVDGSYDWINNLT